MRDHVDTLGVDRELLGEAPAAPLGVNDDRVEALVQPQLRLALAGTRLPREDVVRGQHQRPVRSARGAPARQQVAVELLHTSHGMKFRLRIQAT